MKIKFLVENKTEDPKYLGEHGLSVYIETIKGLRILFDFGASEEVFAHNVKSSGIDLKKINFAVVSHGHFDHTQGAPYFCEVNKTSKIYIHQDAFNETYGTENGEIDKEPCGIAWSKKERAIVENRLSLTKAPVFIEQDIAISGTIDMSLEKEAHLEKFYVKHQDGSFSCDPMEHEQILVIREEGKGLTVFSGCSHKGITPAINCAKDLYPGEKVYAFIAGMHLYSADNNIIEEVFNDLEKENIEIILPIHCTGINSICKIKERLGDKVVVPTAGEEFFI